jgi:hypothetical protein
LNAKVRGDGKGATFLAYGRIGNRKKKFRVFSRAEKCENASASAISLFNYSCACVSPSTKNAIFWPRVCREKKFALIREITPYIPP